MSIKINVNGLPAPQGSKKAFQNKHTGKISVVESAAKTVKPWRADVRAAAEEHGGTIPRGEPVIIYLHFYLPRPKGHFGTGRNAGLLKDWAPTAVTTKPDLDKLIRSTLDALTSAGTYQDDSNVVAVNAWKSYADGRPPGATIELTPWSEVEDDEAA